MPPAKQIAREIFRQTLTSIDIPSVMERRLPLNGTRLILPGTTVDLAPSSRIVVVGIGKAAHAMVSGFAAILPAGISFKSSAAF